MRTQLNVKTIRIALLVTLIVCAAGYIGWRYVELGVYRDLKRFFDAATLLLPHDQGLFLRMDASRSQIPDLEMFNEFDDLKGLNSNLIESILGRKTDLPQWVGMDPFSPPDSNLLLELRFGRVDAPLPPVEYLVEPNQPVWFVVGCGPSRTGAEIVSTGEKDGGVIRYRIVGAPYDASNGLFSEGYLYSDSLGRRLGYFDPFR